MKGSQVQISVLPNPTIGEIKTTMQSQLGLLFLDTHGINSGWLAEAFSGPAALAAAQSRINANAAFSANFLPAPVTFGSVTGIRDRHPDSEQGSHARGPKDRSAGASRSYPPTSTSWRDAHALEW